MGRFRGGLVFKAHRLYVSLNSRLESNKKEERTTRAADRALKNDPRSSKTLLSLNLRLKDLLGPVTRVKKKKKKKLEGADCPPLSSELGTYKIVEARF